MYQRPHPRLQGGPIRKIAFPNDKHHVAEPTQRCLRASVSGDVRRLLGLPKRPTCAGHAPTPPTRVGMPEAAMHQDCELVACQHEVRSPRQGVNVREKPIPSRPEYLGNNPFRGRPTRLDLRHQPTALRNGEWVHSCPLIADATLSLLRRPIERSGMQNLSDLGNFASCSPKITMIDFSLKNRSVPLVSLLRRVE